MADPWGCDGKTCLSSFLHFPFFLPLNKSSLVGSYLKLYFSLSKFWENDENKSSFFGGGLGFGDSLMKHLRFKKLKRHLLWQYGHIRTQILCSPNGPCHLVLSTGLSHVGSNTLAPLSPKSTLHSPEQQ